MKSLLMIFGVLLILMGGLWFLQGVNIVKGSSMTGQSSWALYGGIAVVVGVVLLVMGAKKKAPPRD
jgi:uncharacterized membrane protein YidH (DUF202 family)